MPKLPSYVDFPHLERGLCLQRRTNSKFSQVGISAELPSGSHSHINLDHDSYFEFLLQKHEAYERIPANRFNIEAYVFTICLA